MIYFRDKVRTFPARIHKVAGKRTKFKGGKTAKFNKGIEVELKVHINKILRKLLPAKFQQALDRDQPKSAGDAVVTKIKAQWSAVIGVRFFSMEGSGEKPIVEHGFPSPPKKFKDDASAEFENADTVTLVLTGFEVTDEDDFMLLTVQMKYDEETWAWAGEVFDGKEVKVEITPLKAKPQVAPLLENGGAEEEKTPETKE